jgi:hypothetical protein
MILQIMNLYGYAMKSMHDYLPFQGIFLDFFQKVDIRWNTPKGISMVKYASHRHLLFF